MSKQFGSGVRKSTVTVDFCARGVKNVLLTLIAVVSFYVTPAVAAPMQGLATVFTQPDGTVLNLRVYGDEFYSRTETTDGYTVVFDSETKTYYYAILSADGNEFESTGKQVGKIDEQALGLKKRLEINSSSRAAKARKNYQAHEAVVQREARWKAVKEASKKYDDFKKQVKEQEKAGKKGFVIPMGTIFPDTEMPAPSMAAPTEGDSGGTAEPPIAPAPPSFNLSGNVVGLTVLVDFSDCLGTNVTVQQIDDYCNKPNYTGFSNAGSIYDYFFIQSGGNLRFNNNVTYYVRVPNPKSYYNNTSLSAGICGRQLANDALNVLIASGYDCSNLSVDGSGYVRACTIFFAGENSGVWAKGLWPTSWALETPKSVGSGKSIYAYQISDIGTSLTMGIICHEDSHMLLGYPDLYRYDSNAATVGYFSLMGYGGDLGNPGKTHPSNIDPYLRRASGWMNVIELNSNSLRRCAVDVDGKQLYRYRNPSRTEEYFLFEVRDNTGYEGIYGGSTVSVNPAAGLVAYHVLESGSNGNSSIFTANNPNCNYSTPYELLVLEANPELSKTPWYDKPSPDGSDAFKSSGVNALSDSTSPVALKFWDATGRNTASGCVITNISADGPSMTFVVGSGTLTNTPSIVLSRSTLDSFCDYGGTAPSQTFSLCNGQGGILNYTISTNQSWLSCTPASGTASNETDTITVNFATSGLAAGVHSATITVTDPGASPTNATIAVTLTVFAQPSMSLSSTNISVNGLSGMTAPQASFTIKNTGGGTMAYSLVKTQSWLTLSATNGTVAGEMDTIYVNFDATSLGFGTYQDAITINSSNATNSPLVIPVTLRVLLLAGADIAITGNSLVIAPNSTTPAVALGTDYGIVTGAVEHTFSILNQSAVTTLGLTNAPKVTVSSPSGYFSLSQDAATNSLAPAESTSFKITYNPPAGGLHTGTVSVASTDPALPNYSFAVSGISVGMPAVTNFGAGAAEQGAATLTGGLTAGGVANLYLCWGATDGGTSSTGSWQHVVALGTNIQNSVFTNQVTGLLYGISYDCRVYATNASGTAWSTLRNFSAARPQVLPIAGLISGTIAGAAINTTTPNPGDGDGNAVTNRGPWRAKSKNDWGDNKTFVYTGQMYFDGTPYFFVESIDDNVWLKIDGTVCMNNSTWDDISSSGLISKPQGWYDFELRIHNVGGGSGYVNLNPGFQYHNGGGTSTNDVDNWYPEDPGDATLFRTAYALPGEANSITNTIADNITATTADLHGVLNAYQAVYTVTAFWSTNNNPNPAAWLADTAAGSRVAGTYTNVVNQLISVTATSMPPASAYYFTLRASNALTNIWATSNGAFYKMTPPVVNTSTGAIAVTSTSATLSGSLSDGGIANAWICWGDNDGGVASTSAWDHVQFIGTVNQDAVFSTTVTGLATNTTYFYRCVATNSAGADWSEPATSFSGLPYVGNSGSGYRMKISFPNYNKTETLVNFPVLVIFSNGMAGTTFDFNTFLSANGDDLRFTDGTGTTNLNYEIDTWSTTGSSHVWVQVPEFTNNCSIWARWGDVSQASQPAYTTNGATWGNGYVGVWHMGQTNALDSTVKKYHGVASGNTNCNGYVGGAQAFGTGNQLSIPTFPFTSSALSVEAWVQHRTLPNSIQNYFRLGSAAAALRHDGGFALGQLHFFVTSDGSLKHVRANNQLTVGPWYYVAGTFSGMQRVYKNGHEVWNGEAYGTLANALSAFMGSSTEPMDGYMDEVRISTVSRSTDWLWATYMTMASNAVFTTIGSVQSLATIANLAPTALSDTSALLNAVLATPVTDNTVTVYWGPTDGGTNAVAWTNSAIVGSWTHVAATNISYAVSGLTPGGVYYYTFCATHSQTTAWAFPSWQVAPSGTNVVGKTTPSVSSWPTASNAITYGQALSNAVLSGGSASVSGLFDYHAPNTIPNAGLYSAAVTFTPVDSTNYTSVAGVIEVTVNQVTSTVTSWPTASSIEYGQALSNAVLSGGSASVSGTFVYDAPNTIPNAGLYSAAVTFIPSDTINYTTVAGAINVTVNANNIPVVNAGMDQVVLLEAVATQEGWSYSAWTGDADSGISNKFTYTVAHCFGNNHANVTVNGVTFSESFGTSGAGWSRNSSGINVEGDDNANITGSSEDLAEESLRTAGSYRTVMFTGLTVGQRYQATFFSVAQETGTRNHTFSLSGGSSTNINQDAYGNNNGIKISCEYIATGTSQSFSITEGSAGRFCLYAMANREVYPWEVTVNLEGGAADADSDPLSSLWTTVTGPANVAIRNATALNTSARFTQEGVYLLQLSASDGAAQGVDQVKITVVTNAVLPEILSPTGLMATAVATNQINLAWTDNSTNETGFVIERSLTSGSGFAAIGSVAVNATNYTDSTVSHATTYYYRVVATNVTDNSAYTAEASATTPKISPTVNFWPTASSILIGQALSSSTLSDGEANVPGSFSFVSPAYVPPAGIYSAAVRFTPTDSTNYASVTDSVNVTVIDIYAVPFLEPFEARNLGVLNGQYGWLAEGTDVQTNKTYNNSVKAAEVSGAGGYLKHAFNDARTKVWMDMRVQVVPYTSIPTPGTNSAGAVYVATNGMVMAFNGATPTETGVTVQTNTWVRFTMFSDYTTKRYTLYVDDVRVGKYTFFNATVPVFSGIKVGGKDTVVDDVGVTPNQPAMKYMPSLILLQ